MFEKKPKDKDFYILFRGLQKLIESGETLQHSLVELAPMQNNSILGVALGKAANSLSAGISSGTAFRKEKIFSPMMCAVIDVGDRTGQLSNVFKGLAKILKLQTQLSSKIKSALFIPKAAAVIMTLLVVGYVKFAMPEYMKLYQENHMEMPGPLIFIVDFINGLVDWAFVTVPLIYIVWQGINELCRKYSAVVDPYKLKIPIYGPLHFYVLQYQFCSVMQLMLSSGMTIPEGLGEAAKAVENDVMKRALAKIKKDVITGHSLSNSLRKHNNDSVFDPLLVAAIKAGERSNQLSSTFEDNAEQYSNDLKDLIEPTGTKITISVMLPFGLLIVMLFLFTLIPMFDFITKTTI